MTFSHTCRRHVIIGTMNTNKPIHDRRLTLTVREVSDMLGVPGPTVRSWIRSGVLKSILIGGRRLIRVDDLDGLIHPSPAK